MKVRNRSTCTIRILIAILLFSVSLLLLAINADANTDKTASAKLSKSPSYESYCSMDDSESGLILDTNRVHFLPNESITVTYSIDSAHSITALNYIAEGVTVTSAAIDSNATNRFSIVAVCNTDTDEHKLTVEATIDDGTIETEYLYAFTNEHGTFISPFSGFDAKHKFYVYARENGYMTQEQYENIRATSNGLNIHEELTIERPLYTNIGGASINANTSADEDTCIQGMFLWFDDDGNYFPLRNVKVELYDKDLLTSSLIATTHTGNDGKYSFVFTNQDGFWDFENGGLDVFMRVYAGDDNAMVEISDSGDPYYYQSKVLENITSGTKITWGNVFYMNYSETTYENHEELEALGRAFQISQAILTARDYAWEMMDEKPNDVNVWYPYGKNCAYYRGSVSIRITGNDPANETLPHPYASWDVIMHEYGHHVQWEMGIIDIEGYKHTGTVNESDVHKNKDIGTRLAWSESWPTVFGLMAQYHYSSYISGIDTVNDSWYESYNGVNYDLESIAIKYGEACEFSIIAILWDIFDTSNDENDEVTLSDYDIFELTTATEGKTFSEFISNFYNKYPELTDEIGLNLTYYKMATTKPIVTNTVSNSVAPAISWNPQGGSTDYPNNNFTVIVYGSEGQEILRTNVGNVTSYTLTTAEWRKVLFTGGTTFRVAISATQTSTPLTGPYISALSLNYTKPDLALTSWIITANSRYAEKTVTLDPGEYADYKVKFSSGGVKIIQTFGTGDTELFIYNSDGEEIDYDDSFGYSENSLISREFEADVEYIVRVRYYYSNASGTVKLTITPAKDSHSDSVGSISTYENIKLLNVTDSYEYETYLERGYVNIVTVRPSTSGSYTFELVSNTNTYIYIIDPRSTALVRVNINCADNHKGAIGTDLDPRITLELDAGIKYYVIIAPYSPVLIAENQTVDVALIVTKE